MMKKSQHTCAVCGNTTDNTPYRIVETTQGNGEVFDYFRCARCRCLQLVETPANPIDYYKIGCYAFSDKKHVLSPTTDAPAAQLSWRIIRDRITARRGLGYWYAKYCYLIYGLEPFSWMSPEWCDFDSRILDVGCGSGKLLRQMHRAGFRHPVGIDPFLEASVERDGVRLLHPEKESDRLSGRFSFRDNARKR